MSSGIDTISTEAKRLIQEREEQVKGLFGELQKARRELSTVVDRSTTVDVKSRHLVNRRDLNVFRYGISPGPLDGLLKQGL